MEDVKCYYYWSLNKSSFTENTLFSLKNARRDSPRADGLLRDADTRLRRDAHLRLLEVLPAPGVHHQNADAGVLHQVEQTLRADASWRERNNRHQHNNNSREEEEDPAGRTFITSSLAAVGFLFNLLYNTKTNELLTNHFKTCGMMPVNFEHWADRAESELEPMIWGKKLNIR